jgi:hypothetical protein
MPLSSEERRALTRAHAFVRRYGARGLGPDAGPSLADDLRRVLPDVDDVTIGRVVLQIAGFLDILVRGHPSGVAAVASDQLLLAALDLTSTEWRDAADTR